MKKSICMVLLASLLFLFSACGVKNPALSVSVSAAPISTAPLTLLQETQTAPPVHRIPDNMGGKKLNEFKLDATLDTEAHTLQVTQSLSYHNNTGQTLSEIYFNLIPAAFEKDGGGIDMQSVTAGGAEASLNKSEETVYRLELSVPLEDGQTEEIGMEYTVAIPDIQNRFGYQENVYNLGNFIVTPAVYDENGWAVQPYTVIGDAFYTDVANYEVNLHVPDGYTVAATGKRQSDGSYRAQKVRDFAFCTSNAYGTLTDTADGVEVIVYYGDDMKKTAARMMQTAKNALNLYSREFGAYPYDTLSVVASGLTGGVSGMEYPTLIMVKTDVTLDNMDEMGVADSGAAETNRYLVLIDRTVSHEIAHQWFYGIVGNNQVAYPWIDEGLCRFAEYLYQQEYPPEQPNADTSMEEFFIFMRDGMKEGTYADTTNLSNSLYDWMQNDPMGYSEIYDKGALLLYQMQQQMGDEAFSQALREYVDTFAYGFVTPESFQEFWNGKEDFSALFGLYL